MCAGEGLTENTYLAYYLHRHTNFRDAELHAVSELQGVSKQALNLKCLSEDPSHSPFRLVDFPSHAVAKAVAQRSLLVKVSVDIPYLERATCNITQL